MKVHKRKLLSNEDTSVLLGIPLSKVDSIRRHIRNMKRYEIGIVCEACEHDAVYHIKVAHKIKEYIDCEDDELRTDYKIIPTCANRSYDSLLQCRCASEKIDLKMRKVIRELGSRSSGIRTK
jgi:hypothetical protein